jgi:hypothetical protein
LYDIKLLLIISNNLALHCNLYFFLIFILIIFCQFMLILFILNDVRTFTNIFKFWISIIIKYYNIIFDFRAIMLVFIFNNNTRPSDNFVILEALDKSIRFTKNGCLKLLFAFLNIKNMLNIPTRLCINYKKIDLNFVQVWIILRTSFLILLDWVSNQITGKLTCLKLVFLQILVYTSQNKQYIFNIVSGVDEWWEWILGIGIIYFLFAFFAPWKQFLINIRLFDS